MCLFQMTLTWNIHTLKYHINLHTSSVVCFIKQESNVMTEYYDQSDLKSEHTKDVNNINMITSKPYPIINQGHNSVPIEIKCYE